jgi:hypothetical protein
VIERGGANSSRGSALAWPLPLSAQQAAMPVIRTYLKIAGVG